MAGYRHNVPFMVKCWASSIGGCCTTQSAEHYVSDCFWPDDLKAIKAHGFPWCLGSPHPVGRNSLTANILCKRHNERLGAEVDGVAKQLHEALRCCIEIGTTNERREAKTFLLDGWQLERWFLKTLINCCVGTKAKSDLKWIDVGSRLEHPPHSLVAAAFGQEKPLAPMGLYSAGFVGQQTSMAEQVLQFSPLIWHGGAVAGGLFTVMGLRYLLYVGTALLPNLFRLPVSGHQHWDESYLEHRPSGIGLNAGGVANQLVYSWG